MSGINQCSLCGARGHTKPKCPQNPKYVAKMEMEAKKTSTKSKPVPCASKKLNTDLVGTPGKRPCMWPFAGEDYAIQFNGCSRAEAHAFAKKHGFSVYAESVSSRKTNSVYLMKRYFPSFTLAKRFAKKNNINFEKLEKE